MEAFSFYGLIALLFAVSVVLGRFSGPVLIRILSFFVGKTKSTLDDRVLDAIKVPLESFFFIIVFYLLMHAFPDLSQAAAFLEQYIYAIIVIIATFMLSEASGAAIRWYYEEGHKEARHVKIDLSLLPLLRKITKLVIYLAGLTIALSTTGFDVTGILAVTSVIGLILGLASQETLANVFAGIALQVDRPYHYGDYLRLTTGEIVRLDKIGMRTTRLSDMAHNTVIISNSEFAKLRVVNLTLPDDESIITVSVELPLGTDIEALKRKIEERLRKEKPKGLMLDKGIAISVDAVRLQSVQVLLSFWIDGYQYAGSIREIANRDALAFAQEIAKKKK